MGAIILPGPGNVPSSPPSPVTPAPSAGPHGRGGPGGGLRGFPVPAGPALAAAPGLPSQVSTRGRDKNVFLPQTSPSSCSRCPLRSCRPAGSWGCGRDPPKEALGCRAHPPPARWLLPSPGGVSFPCSLCFRLEEVLSLALDLLTQSPVASQVVSVLPEAPRGGLQSPTPRLDPPVGHPVRDGAGADPPVGRRVPKAPISAPPGCCSIPPDTARSARAGRGA